MHDGAERVGLVVVSHSARLAAGVAEVAGQMAPDVTVAAAGGTADGGIGTDFDAVSEALARVGAAAVLYDLGSARMVAELAVESLDDPSRVVLVDAPLVEGAVAAAVAAQGGADLAAVASAARAAGSEPEVAAPAEGEEIRVRLTNEIGLHARPAALTARTLSELDASVTVRFGDKSADGTSVLALMALGARGGDEVVVSATGRQSDDALRAFADLAARDFDE
ncbi:dihydroxyacetone kinase phosphoryl donor subunit DhaM [Actinophytocola gossypii]|uniref:dihydroxyacetone kinase phosphoryl donor subunit DhaM n=1 Tax=Actinophytocola gossypii TaxID=2812003 RepID=UPI0021A7681A|nr:dihydroxyacetone kinase phosphoryl donor subunit DhaM [Actinophytocola gossypii]